MRRLHRTRQRCANSPAKADPSKPAPERDRLRWMIEEFRVSLFAQELKTLAPVSAKRLDEQLRLARREL